MSYASLKLKNWMCVKPLFTNLVTNMKFLVITNEKWPPTSCCSENVLTINMNQLCLALVCTYMILYIARGKYWQIFPPIWLAHPVHHNFNLSVFYLINVSHFMYLIWSSPPIPWGFTGVQFSQVNSHMIQPPRVVGVAMDTVSSYPLSFNHSVRYVQDGVVLIGSVIIVDMI